MTSSFFRGQVFSLLAVLYCSGCSQDFFSKESEAPSDESDEEDENLVADQPVEVTGSYLTIHCDAQGFAIDKDNNIAEDPVVSCIIKNADGTRFDQAISSIKSKVFVGDTAVTAETLVSASPPWHFYVQTTEENRKKISSGSFEVVSAERTEVVETSVFDYKWYEDPIFAILVIALTANSDAERVADSVAEVLTFAPKSHFVFVSDQLFPGNFGIVSADAYCDLEGKKVIPDRNWRVLAGRATETVKERIQIRYPVFNLFGKLISSEQEGISHEQSFWRDFHYYAFRITQSGKDTHLFNEFNGKLQVIDYAWTGYDFAGAKDLEFGDCNGWTSNDANVFGGLGYVQDANKWTRYQKMSCDRAARISCISI